MMTLSGDVDHSTRALVLSSGRPLLHFCAAHRSIVKSYVALIPRFKFSTDSARRRHEARDFTGPSITAGIRKRKAFGPQRARMVPPVGHHGNEIEFFEVTAMTRFDSVQASPEVAREARRRAAEYFQSKNRPLRAARGDAQNASASCRAESLQSSDPRRWSDHAPSFHRSAS